MTVIITTKDKQSRSVAVANANYSNNNNDEEKSGARDGDVDVPTAGKRLKFVPDGTSAGPTMKWPTSRHGKLHSHRHEIPKMAAQLDCICGHCTYAALDIGASGFCFVFVFVLGFVRFAVGVACVIKYALEMFKNALKSQLAANHN